MEEINFVNLWFLFAALVVLFIIGLSISRYLDSVRLFHFLSIVCAILALSMPIFLKFQSWYPFASIHVINLAVASGFLFALKFLELSFGEEWEYIRSIRWKQLAMSFSAFPETVNSNREYCESARRQSLFSIFRGIVQLVILRIVVRLTPVEWFSQSLSSLSPTIWPCRYALLGLILYLILGMASNFVFGIAGFLWNTRMNSMFPSFPFFATSLRDFWSYRWNTYVKVLLHRVSFIVAPKLNKTNKMMSKRTSGFMAFALSAVFHEYLFILSYGRWSGKNLLFFLLHGVLMRLEIDRQSTVKSKTPMEKFWGWTRTMGILLITSPLFFDPWIKVNYFLHLKQTFG
jgi:hypothetical protein